MLELWGSIWALISGFLLGLVLILYLLISQDVAFLLLKIRIGLRYIGFTGMVISMYLSLLLIKKDFSRVSNESLFRLFRKTLQKVFYLVLGDYMYCKVNY